MASFPKYLIETVGIITIIVIFLYSKNFDSTILNIIPLIGTFVFGIQRILPSFNQIYNCWSYISSFKYSTKKIIEILNDNSTDINDSISHSKYNLKFCIEFQNIIFKYPNSKNQFLII